MCIILSEQPINVSLADIEIKKVKRFVTKSDAAWPHGMLSNYLVATDKNMNLMFAKHQLPTLLKQIEILKQTQNFNKYGVASCTLIDPNTLLNVKFCRVIQKQKERFQIFNSETSLEIDDRPLVYQYSLEFRGHERA